MNSLADTQPIQSKAIRPVFKFSRQQTISYGLSAVSIILSVVLWQLLSHYHINLGIVNFANVPSPLDVVRSFVAFVELDTALAHVKASIGRVLIGFVLAGFVGVILGLLIGYSKTIAAIFMPPLEILRPIPAVAWIPLAILIFPSSEASMIFITFLGALFPILLNTIHGVEAVDRRLIASAKSLGAGQFAILREVIIPGSLPSITTGLAIGMGTCWFCLVTAEMISGQLGIGYFTWESFTLQNYADIIVGMLLIGALGMLSSALLRYLGKKLTPWYQLRKA
ncbi:ABC transporter permease [Acinetobacter sp. VNH17]|uniref:ABC transporter permease n=1 Tax=Acinetobacter thutiue TaxID=2998078 RepID=A0ABT7WNG9_9GAMM|nr:ABC transporter permease [Acinetobacter thutiue]MCY6412123.1 ABC transporter permease [Acinetobacter thutiue]MDN0014227.1 ABC transporter permease [Acinetobacter thutiue]